MQESHIGKYSTRHRRIIKMDLFEKGKSLAQEGHYEEALDAFVLALENDKENADIHFYLGLCYSSLEDFRYAKYHYDMALTLKPNHAKTRLVYDGLKGIVPEKPPERRITRQAAAKIRRSQAAEVSEEKSDAPETLRFETSEPPRPEPKLKLTDDKWENAFPAHELMKPEKGNAFTQFILTVIGLAVIASLIYYGYTLYR